MGAIESDAAQVVVKLQCGTRECLRQTGAGRGNLRQRGAREKHEYRQNARKYSGPITPRACYPRHLLHPLLWLIECASVRVRIAIFVLLAASALSAETIILKNGKRIVVDTVREKNNRVEYEIGEDIYAIPKSLVEKIEEGGVPAPRSSHVADLP